MQGATTYFRPVTVTPLDHAAAAAQPILWDAGVLGDGPVCELGGWAGAGRHALLPLRADALRARACGVTVLEDGGTSVGPFAQCVVHLQKSRSATLQDVATAVTMLAADGELLVIGYNALGIRSFGKQLDRLLATDGKVRSNRRRGRVLAYARAELAVPGPPAGSRFEIESPIPMHLTAEPGVFSEGRLDPGSALLLQHLPQLPPPARVLDMGCGAGSLGLQALSLFAGSDALLLDADLRAVRSARQNAATLGLSQRARIDWWDASEALPVAAEDPGFDLVLINPPFHSGKQVDMGPAFAMFEHAAAHLAPGGSALIVANRTLPYEPALRALGELQPLSQPLGFKLLLLRPRSR